MLIGENSIHSNGELGIDVGGDGVTPNSAGNTFQNYPTNLSVEVDGTSTTITGSITLSGGGTQSLIAIDWFSSVACDASGHGEGTVHLARVPHTSQLSSFTMELPVVVPGGAFISGVASANSSSVSRRASRSSTRPPETAW